MSSETATWIGFRSTPVKKSGKETPMAVLRVQHAGTLKLIMAGDMRELDIPEQL